MLNLSLFEYLSTGYESNKTCNVYITNPFDTDELTKDTVLKKRTLHQEHASCSSYIQGVQEGSYIAILLKSEEISTINLNKTELDNYVNFINELCYNTNVTYTQEGTTFIFLINIRTNGGGIHAYTAFCLIRYLKYKYFFPVVDFILKYQNADLSAYIIFICAHYYIHFYAFAKHGVVVNPYFSAVGMVHGMFNIQFNLFLFKKLPSSTKRQHYSHLTSYVNSRHIAFQKPLHRLPGILKEKMLNAFLQNDIDFIKKLL